MKTELKQIPVSDISEDFEYNGLEGKGVMKNNLSQIPVNGCKHYSIEQVQQARTTRFCRCN